MQEADQANVWHVSDDLIDEVVGLLQPGEDLIVQVLKTVPCFKNVILPKQLPLLLIKRCLMTSAACHQKLGDVIVLTLHVEGSISVNGAQDTTRAIAQDSWWSTWFQK